MTARALGGRGAALVTAGFRGRRTGRDRAGGTVVRPAGTHDAVAGVGCAPTGAHDLVVKIDQAVHLAFVGDAVTGWRPTPAAGRARPAAG